VRSRLVIDARYGLDGRADLTSVGDANDVYNSRWKLKASPLAAPKNRLLFFKLSIYRNDKSLSLWLYMLDQLDSYVPKMPQVIFTF
jgi:hypothetical protein